jgi:very-short-patch-repair endonuclease
MTPAEQVLWDHLRGRRLDDLKFRRQHPLGPFIVDFFCPAHRLVVELDGEVHDYQLENDRDRTCYLKSQGYQVIRFRNAEVERDIESVLTPILKACLLPSPKIVGRAGDEG